MHEQPGGVVRTTLGVMFLAGLTLASLWILSPFLPALIWAATIVVTTWPLMLRVQRRLWDKRGLAVAVMTAALLLIFIVPLMLAVGVVADNGDTAISWMRALPERQVPPPPEWLNKLPVVGSRIVDTWQHLAESGWGSIAPKVKPYISDFARWLVTEAGAMGMLVVQCLLIIILCVVLYAGGEGWGSWMISFGRQLAAERGAAAVVLAGKAIRGVAMGVVLTALAQAVAGGVGLFVAGVPLAGLLTVVMFVCCIAQIGPLPVMLICTGWLYGVGEAHWGTFLLVWSVATGTMDNLIRPVLIRRGADLPLLLIFAGVIGGLLAFGLVGLFVGPVVLAVTYTLIDAWVNPPTAATDAPPSN